MVATAQRFFRVASGCENLLESAPSSISRLAGEKLTERYDLLVIDHPFCGYAPIRRVLPLDEHLPGSFLAEQAANAVELPTQATSTVATSGRWPRTPQLLCADTAETCWIAPERNCPALPSCSNWPGAGWLWSRRFRLIAS